MLDDSAEVADGDAVVASVEDENATLLPGEPRRIFHVDDVSDRTVAEHALTAKITCSRHGSVINVQQTMSKERSITNANDRKADAAARRCSDGAGCYLQKRKIIPEFVAKQHCEIVCRAVIADDLVTKKCAAMKKHSLRWRHLVSVDDPKRSRSNAGIAPCSVGDEFSTPVGPIWPQTPA